ncbi:MAG: YidC/Oxa1 family membrane protein insertase [Clostridia bacterium]
MGFISQIFGYLLNFLYEVFNNYGIAIIVFSILLRIVLIPLTVKQQKTMKKSAVMQGKMQELQRKYKSNPEKLNQEMMDMYKKEKMSPFSGCLSSILQLVIILSVFWLVSQPLTYMKGIDKQTIEDYKTQIQQENDGKISTYPEIEIIEKKGTDNENVRINMDFLGIDLSKVPTQSLNDWRVYVIPVLYVITSFVSIKITTNAQKKLTKKKEIVVENGEEKQPNELDSMQQMNNTMLYMMPIMSISIAVIAPLGLALYWLVSNILMIVERLVIDKVMNAKEDVEDAK